MAGGKSNIRKPLSPVKANEQKLKHANKPARSTKPNKIDFAAQSATKPKEQPAEAVRSSKIPRATPSPGPRRLSVGPSPPGSQPSKIPRPISAYRNPENPSGIPKPGSSSLPGFHAFSNPSFDVAQQGTPAPAPLPNALSTPEALQIMQEVAKAEDVDATQGMGAIINAYLRTGPQKLSPEPSKDYCIVAPKPTAAAHTTHLRPPVSAVVEVPQDPAQNDAPRHEIGGTAAPAEDTLLEDATVEIVQGPQPVAEQSAAEVSFSAFIEGSPEVYTNGFDSVEQHGEDAVPSTAPPSVCSNVPDVFGDLEEDEMEKWGNIGEDEIAAELQMAELEEEQAALEGNTKESPEMCPTALLLPTFFQRARIFLSVLGWWKDTSSNLLL